MNIKIPKLGWLWIPIILMVVQAGIEIFVPYYYLGVLHSEGGPHELLQFAVALLALMYALKCLPLAIKAKQLPLIIWVACFCLGCAYITGEEISWGQHVFEWGTPDFWLDVNDQAETNLHNTSSWLDQKPRLVLLMGVVVGGLIIPALQKFKPEFLPQNIAIIYPPAILSVTAAFALCVKITDKVQDFVDIDILSRASEVEELYLFYFVLLYLIILYGRMLDAGVNNTKVADDGVASSQ